MNDSNKEPFNKKDLIQLIIMILVTITTLIILIYATTNMYIYEPQQLKNHIDNMENITDEYQRGWNDCIKYLEQGRQQATNVTLGGI